MKASTPKTIARDTFYGFCKRLCIGSLTVLTAARYFNVPPVEDVQRGLLIASNHQSFLDPMLIGLALPCPIDYMARSSLFSVPGFGALIGTLGAHPVERGRIDRSGLRAILHVLRSDRPLLMFPEGTRSDDGSLGTFKSGVGTLAVRCNVPVLPACVEGAFESWPRHRALPRPGRAAVAYGEFIETDGLGEPEVTARMKEQIEGMQDRLKEYLAATRPRLWPTAAR